MKHKTYNLFRELQTIFSFSICALNALATL